MNYWIQLFHSFVLLLLLPNFLAAQIFSDQSIKLPFNGATGQSMDVQAADLDQDGDLDIVLANEFQANTLLLNDGTGKFTNQTVGNLPQKVHDSEDVAIADFNGDGHLDLVFCSEDDIKLNRSNVHEYYWGSGAGKFMEAPFSLPDSEANAVITADLNQDNHADLLFGINGSTTILINNGDGSFTNESQRIPTIRRVTQDLNLTDIDNDGDLDLLEGNENGNQLFINDGNGFFTNETTNRLPQGINMETRKVTFGDIDQDGDQDIFLANVAFIAGKNRQNRLYQNDGNGFFTDITEANLPTDVDHTIDAIFEDVDLDDDVDLIIANVFGSPIRIYENMGDGRFEDASTKFLGNQPHIRDALGVIAFDANGDQLKDLYFCDRNTGTNNKDLLLFREDVAATLEGIPPIHALKITPNPTPGSLYLFFNLDQNQQLAFSLMDTIGQKVLPLKKIASYISGAHQLSFDISEFALSSGPYFLVIENGLGQKQILKVIYQG